MASFMGVGLRLVQGAWRRSASTYIKEIEVEEHHAVGLTNTWRNISLFVAIPMCVFAAYNGYQKEQDHIHHIEEHGKPEFRAYSHLRVRTKPFPWGDGNHSLFHNPEANALPEGYEE